MASRRDRKSIEAARLGEFRFLGLSPNWIAIIVIQGLIVVASVIVLVVTRDTGDSAPPFLTQIFSVAISPEDAKVRVLGDLTGLYRTKDAGRKWERVAALDKSIYKVFSDPAAPSVFYAAGDGFFLRSDDSGKTWRDIATDLPVLKIRALGVEPQQARSMYAFVQGDGLYRSGDAGQKWSRVLPLADASMTTLAIRPGDPKTVFALHTSRGFVRSDDGGATFRPVGGGIPSSRVTDVLMLPQEPQTMFAVSAGTVYRSADGGENWQTSNSGLQNVEVVAISRDRTTGNFYAVSVEGLFWASSDGGRSWSEDRG